MVTYLAEVQHYQNFETPYTAFVDVNRLQYTEGVYFNLQYDNHELV